MKRKLSVAFEITVLIIAAQIIMYILFSTILVSIEKSTATVSQKETFNLLHDSILWSIEDELLQASLLIDTLRSDSNVLRLFKNQNRNDLYKYMLPTYEQVQHRVTRIHFHLPNGNSFLRLHNPSSYGDNLLAIRPMIKTANNLRSSIKGIEIGRDGIGLRVIEPLYYHGEFLGLLECGMEFGTSFLERLKSKYGYDFYIFLFDKTNSLLFLAGTQEKDKCPLAEKNLLQLQKGENIWALDCKEVKAVALYPFTDYAGTYIGFIKVEIQSIPLIDAISKIKERYYTLSSLLTIFITICSFLGLQLIIKPLNSVVKQTKILSQKIIQGDLSLPSTVYEPTYELQEIVNAVNEIILTLHDRSIILQAIVEGIPGIVFYVNEQFTILWANNAAKEYIGNSTSIYELAAKGGFFENEINFLKEVFLKNNSLTYEACYLKNGVQECWEHVAVPVLNESSTVHHVIRISRNITDKKMVETELRLLNENLEIRVEKEIENRKENERIAQLQSRLAAIGELATGMAHEITQPLNSITMAIGNLEASFSNNTITSDYLKSKIKAINADIDRVRRVIDHVRTFARGAPDNYKVAFSINDCIENALQLLGVQLSTHYIEVQLHLDKNIPEIHGNPYQYEQVIINLLSNARDAIEERLLNESAMHNTDPVPGVIEISTYQQQNYCIMTIVDNGIGIKEEYADRIFDPFFTTKSQGKGTGLGLSIAYGIITKMQGTIKLSPTPQGTKAIIEVPVSRREELPIETQ